MFVTKLLIYDKPIFKEKNPEVLTVALITISGIP
jgi:hypothetical protein